jgi:hypothetical protein
MYTKYEGMILTICGKDGEDHVVQLGFALVSQENKFYWQEIFNAIFDYLRDHRMTMSDSKKVNDFKFFKYVMNLTYDIYII